MASDKNILILASGSGSNAETIAKYARDNLLPVGITAACNRPPEKAAVYQKLEKYDIRTRYVPSPGQDFRALRKVLSDGNFGARFDLIVLAGYMRILPADIAESYNMLNIHPSVLPFVYKGSEDGYADALANRDKIVGCTVHMVTKDVDAGPRLYQVGFGMPDEIIANENLDLLRQIGLAHEHALYPLVVRNIVFNMDQMISMPAVRGAALDNLRARCLPPVKTVFPENGAVFEYWNPATGKSR